MGTLALAVASTAHTAPVLDQSSSKAFANSFYSDINYGPTPEVGQTFKAGISGRISNVSLGLYRDQLFSGSNPIGFYDTNAEIRIRDANNVLLGSATISSADIPLRTAFNASQPTSVMFNLDALGINLTAGQTYSFGITPTTVVGPNVTGGNGLDLAATFPTYADGNPFVSYNGGPRSPFFANTYDLIFDTYMTPALTIEPLSVMGAKVGANGSTWNYQYEAEVKDFTVYLREKIELVGDAPPQSLLDQWLAGMNGMWSNQYQINDGEFNYKIVVDASFVSSGGDQVVNFSNGSGQMNMLNWYAINGWDQSRQGAAAAHELGHMLGVYDEYMGGATDRNAPAQALCQSPGKTQIYCNSLMSDLGPVQERYFADVLAALQGRTDRNLTLARLPPGPGGYVPTPPLPGLIDEPPLNSAVPEPGTYLLLILGFGSLGAALRRKNYGGEPGATLRM